MTKSFEDKVIDGIDVKIKPRPKPEVLEEMIQITIDAGYSPQVYNGFMKLYINKVAYIFHRMADLKYLLAVLKKRS